MIFILNFCNFYFSKQIISIQELKTFILQNVRVEHNKYSIFVF